MNSKSLNTGKPANKTDAAGSSTIDVTALTTDLEELSDEEQKNIAGGDPGGVWGGKTKVDLKNFAGGKSAVGGHVQQVCPVPWITK